MEFQPPDGYEEISDFQPPEGYEEIKDKAPVRVTGATGASAIPGGELRQPPTAEPIKSLIGAPGRALAGLGEAGLNLATGLGSYVVGGALGHRGATRQEQEDNAAKMMKSTTYQPRTEEGQKITDALGEVVNQIGAPLMGLHMGGGPKAEPLKKEEFRPPQDFESMGAEPPKPWTPPPGYEEMSNESQQMPLFNPDEQGKTANLYGAAAGDWRTDENGIPIRADLSMDAQNAQDPLQRNLWGDQLDPTMNPVGQAADLRDVNGLQEQTPLPEAIDNMPEGPGRTQALDLLSKNAIEASPVLQGAVEEARRQTSVPRGQRGGVDFDAVAKLLQNVMEKTNDFLGKLSEKTIDPLTPGEHVVADALGNRTYIPKPEAPTDIITKALGEQDGRYFFDHLQSGLQSYGDKVKSSLATGVARWLSYGDKVGNRYVVREVRPVDSILTKLNTKDLVNAMQTLREDMHAERESSPEEMKAKGHSDKAIEAVHAVREAYRKVLDVTNATNRALGKPEVKPMDAFMASMWHGNWHVPILDKKGGTAWYIKAATKGEALKAIEWMKKDPVLSKELSLDKAEPKYHNNEVGNKVPSDAMGAYQSMLKMVGDSPAAAIIKEAMEQHIAEQGYRFQGVNKHLEPGKASVRGYMGDRPWLSDTANATQQAKAQVKYLAQAYRWAGMQEAFANVKEVLSHPELNESQPNNMSMAKMYTAQAMGASKNIMKVPEQALQKFMTSLPVQLKFLPSSINKFVGSLKNMTYLTQLGMSGGYMIATPLQAFLLGPARHMQLSDQGAKYNMVTTATKALLDFSSGLVTGKAITQLGRDAFTYMHDNGVISQNIFHETSGLGENKIVHAGMKTIGWTISMPEKVARAATFMSFVHHLSESGKYTGQGQMFLRAEELTNHTLTDFRRMSRPLAVDYAGALGELAYTYKSPMFNQYNSLMEFSRNALKGKPGPLLAALGMTAVMGGLTSLPFVNEADAVFNLMKDGVARAWPEAYPAWSGLGLKGTMISESNAIAKNESVLSAIGQKPAKFLADTSAYGAVSAATGSQMASRFASNIGDIANPLGNIAPVGQELREWIGAGHGLLNPNKTNITQGAYEAVAPPAVKGMMENSMDVFKGPKRPNGQGYVNPTQLADPKLSYVRTPDEEFKRNFGLTSLQEANTKNARYLSNQEAERFHNAQEASMSKMWGAIVDKRKSDVTKYAHAYFDNNGDAEKFTKELDSKIEGYILTPEERQLANLGKNIAGIRKYQNAKAIREGK